MYKLRNLLFAITRFEKFGFFQLLGLQTSLVSVLVQKMASPAQRRCPGGFPAGSNQDLFLPINRQNWLI